LIAMAAMVADVGLNDFLDGCVVLLVSYARTSHSQSVRYCTLLLSQSDSPSTVRDSRTSQDLRLLACCFALLFDFSAVLPRFQQP